MLSQIVLLQVCSYFKDPLTCIGPVAAGQVRVPVEHTAGEKRITSKVGAFNHLRKWTPRQLLDANLKLKMDLHFFDNPLIT